MITKRAGAGVALALILAGCGGSPFPKAQAPTAPRVRGAAVANVTPQARLLAAVQRTTDERTARIALTMEVSGYATGFASTRTTSATGSGVMDLTDKQMMLTLVAPGSDGESKSAEIRLVGGTVYVNGGGGWTSQPYTATGTSTPDPNGELDYLQGVGGSVRVVGTDLVRGVSTTRYSTTLDLRQALARARTTAQRSALLHSIAVLGDVHIPVAVWIDDAGRLRKMHLSLDLGAAAQRLGAPAGVDPKIAVTLELYDFGVPVNVQAPAGAKNATAVAQDRAVQADLRNALTAEKTKYTDDMAYTSDSARLSQIEPSLDWGGRLSVVVGPSGNIDGQVVCLSERSKSGTRFALADVAYGTNAGTYYGTNGCPAAVDEVSFSRFRSDW